MNCPAQSTRSDIGSGYTTIAGIINGFVKLNQLPTDRNAKLPYWDEGGGIEATFAQHRAKWHVKCRQRLVHVTKLDRLQKCETASAAASDDIPAMTDSDNGSKNDEDIAEKVPRLMRSNVGPAAGVDNDVCFFCDESGLDLHQVMTFDVDERVCKCAALVNDDRLTCRLGVIGDMIAQEAKYLSSCLIVATEIGARRMFC